MREPVGSRPADRRLAIVAIVRAMSLDDADLASRRSAADLDEEDAARLRTLKPTLERVAEPAAAEFVRYLTETGAQRSASAPSTTLLDEVRVLKRQHLLAIAQGEFGMSYVLQRIELAYLYSTLGFEVRWFLGAYERTQRALAREITATFAEDPEAAQQVIFSLQKLQWFDVSLILDTLIVQRERTIQEQQDAIRELSTPVLQVRPGLLVLPVIGVIDTARAFQLTEQLLRAIRANRARVVVLDITGVAGLDSKVANHLVQTVEAARLMGATTIISGLSPEVAQAIVTIGVELSRVNTVGDLQRGLEVSERLLGYRLVSIGEEGGATPRV